MKRVMYKSFFPILVAFLMAVAAGAVFAQVYKTVDEDGNVIYTDMPPRSGAKPVKLAPISVIEAPVYEQAEEVADQGTEGEDGNKMTLKELRRNYRDFAIVAPMQDESVWNPEAPVSVAWTARYQLQQGMQVLVYVDGRLQAKTTEQITPVPDLERGEHSVEAKLIDDKNRTIATTEPVTFYIRRPNIYSTGTRPRPRG